MKTRSLALGQVRGFRGEMVTPTADIILITQYASAQLAEDLARAATKTTAQALSRDALCIGAYAAARARLEWSQTDMTEGPPTVQRKHIDAAIELFTGLRKSD